MNTLYDKGREGILDGSISWMNDSIRAILIDTGQYTFDPAHANLSNIPAGARVTAGVALTGKSATNGVADANDVTFTSVSGPSTEAIALYKHTGTDSSSRLLLFIDTGTGLPVIPNGGDLTVQWSNGANKLFKL